MIGLFASNTCMPSYGGTCASNSPLRVDRVDRLDAGGVGDDLVLLAERRRDVHDAGAVLGGDVVGGEDLVRVRLPAGEEVERRRVARADQLRCR